MLEFLLSDPLTVYTYFALGLAILSLWHFKSPWVWASLYTFSVAGALVSHRVTMLSIGFILWFAWLCYLFFRKDLRGWLKAGVGVLLGVSALLLGLHKIPGFLNLQVFSQAALSPDSLPFDYYLNLDKSLIGLFLIGFGTIPIRKFQDWKKVIKQTALPLALACLCLLGPAFILGYIRVDLKWYSFSWLWLTSNLLFTCVAEEAFFRGFLQKEFDSLIGAVPALILSSLLFGLVHLKGGGVYILLSVIAGLFYGYVFMKTKRIEASVFLHFTVNAIHFLIFSYPGLKIS